MEAWNQAIGEIKEGLNNQIYRNETAVSQSIVRRLIGLLGWNVNNPAIVYPEYQCGSGGRVDYALLNESGQPLILIEVKAVGLINDNITEQLIRYAFGSGASIMVLTDGKEWHFFYTTVGNVPMSERRFYKIDLSDRDSEDIYRKMQKFIGNEAAISGQAAIAAEETFRSASMKRKAKQSLPLAFKQLVDSEDEALCEVISEKVADLSGITPDKSAVFEYLRSLETKPTTTPAASPTPRFPKTPEPTTKHPTARSNFRMLGVPVGSILIASFDPSHKFQTVDEQNKIQDLNTGDVMPISRMANTLLGGSRNGYEYFCYKGKKLADIRREIDKRYKN